MIGQALNAQIVSFNSPTEWMTLRSTAIEAKVLIDTAKIENKRLTMKLEKVSGGRVQTLNSKTAPVTDYAASFDLGAAGASMLGGSDYLRIAWQIPGSDQQGAIAPFGVAVLDSSTELAATLSAAHGKSADLDDTHMVAVGAHMLGAVYDQDALTLAIKKGGSQKITVAFDGKNGKYAFVSYSDRFITIDAENDSADAYFYRRSVSDTGIVYRKDRWVAEIDAQATDGYLVVRAPWHDLGLLPFDGRIIGFAVWADEAAAVPGGAQRFVPATWGNLYIGQQKGAESK
jgi:hypothetical protein